MTSPPPQRSAIVLALISIYLAWGATYVAIAIAVRTMPPLLMASVRFVVAGTLMLVVLRARGEALPTRAEWRGAGIIGVCMLAGGNGAVSLVSRSVPSSLIALIIALTPLVISMMSFAITREAPSRMTMISIALGLVGVLVLVGTPDRRALASLTEVGFILFAIVTWAIGSVLASRLPLPSSSLMASAAQLVSGGIALLIAGTLRGEFAQLDLAHATYEAALAMLYLTFVGSILGFGAYAFLLKHASPAVATSYAYVNPLVALVLGHTLAKEPIDARTLLGAGIIVTAVVLLVREKRR